MEYECESTSSKYGMPVAVKDEERKVSLKLAWSFLVSSADITK